MTIRVFVVDDQDLVRAGCLMVIQAQDDMAVAGEAADGAQALERLAVTAADVVLMDVRMPASTVSPRPGNCWPGSALTPRFSR